MKTVLFALLLASTQVNAGTLRAAVIEQLSGIEDPPSQQALAALGDDVVSELIEISTDSSVLRSQRARALHALGWFPSDQTMSVLSSALDGTDSVMARKAIYALGNGWGDAALPQLTPKLSSEDVQIRRAAAQSLSNIDTDTARAALSVQLLVETDARVRSVLQRGLGQ